MFQPTVRASRGPQLNTALDLTMRVMKGLALFSGLALLCGCATTNIPGTAAYERVPESQFIASPQPGSGSEENATVYVKRDPGFTGSALSSVLLLNGKPIVKIKPGQFVQLSLAPTEYLFGVTWSDNLGALETSNTREIPINCKSGQTYYVRMFPQPMVGLVIERTSQ